jgi:nitroreductase
VIFIRKEIDMNTVLEAIKKRRSVRFFHSKPVERDIVTAIIEAGNQAPSAGNLQPWRFIIVEDEKIKKLLLEVTLSKWHKIVDYLKNTRPEYYKEIMFESRYSELEEPKDPIYFHAPIILFVIAHRRHAVDCALACQNIMLSAYSLGLGTCYVGFGAMVTDNTEIRKILELKDDEQIHPIVIGYPKEDLPRRPPKKKPQIRWI